MHEPVGVGVGGGGGGGVGPEGATTTTTTTATTATVSWSSLIMTWLKPCFLPFNPLCHRNSAKAYVDDDVDVAPLQFVPVAAHHDHRHRHQKSQKQIEGEVEDNDEHQPPHTTDVTMTYLSASPLVVHDASVAPPSPHVDLSVALPIDTLAVEEERRLLQQTMHSTVKFEHLTLQSLAMAITVKPSTMLHLSCHGLFTDTTTYVMALEQPRDGTALLLTMDRLRRLLNNGASRPSELVVLLACYSERAGRLFVDAGVQHVVACRAESRVLDECARVFSRFFYASLFEGHSVRRAFEIACVNVDIAFDDDTMSNVFVLLPHNSPVHDTVRFFSSSSSSPSPPRPQPQQPQAQKQQKQLCRASSASSAMTLTLPPRTDHAIGRQAEVQQVIGHLRRHRCVNITGYVKYGKSTVAKAASHWIAERHMFESGVLWIDMSLGDDYAHATQQLLAPVRRLARTRHEIDVPVDADFCTLLQTIATWDVLLCLDNCNSPFAATSLVMRILESTHSPRLLVTGVPLMMPVESGFSHATVYVRQLPPAACRQLVYRLCPWLKLQASYNEQIDRLIRDCNGSPYELRKRCRDLHSFM